MHTYDPTTLNAIRNAVNLNPSMLDTVKRTYPGALEQLGMLPTEAPKPADPLANLMPVVLGVSQRISEAVRAALPVEEHEKFMQYVAAGAPGVEALAKEGKFTPLIELTWELLKEGMPQK